MNRAEKSRPFRKPPEYAYDDRKARRRCGLAGAAIGLTVLAATQAFNPDVFRRVQYDHAVERIDDTTTAESQRGLNLPPEPMVFNLVGRYTNECPKVEPGALKLARKLIAHGGAFSQQRLWDWEHGVEPEEAYAVTEAETDAAEFHKYERAADMYGQVVHDMRPYMEALDSLRPGAGGEEPSFAEYLEQVNAYFSHFGVEVVVPDELNDEARKDKFQVVTSDERESYGMKSLLRKLMRTFSAYPDEFVRDLAGLEKILLFSGEDSKFAGAVIGFPDSTMLLNISNADEDTIAHEMMHLTDAAGCGGSKIWSRDSGYAHFNAPSVKYGKNDPVSYADTKKAAVEMRAQRGSAYYGTSFITDYSGSKIVEDKAEVGKYIFKPEGRSAMTGEEMPPRIRGKYRYLVGRLAQTSPALAYYFTDIQDIPPQS